MAPRPVFALLLALLAVAGAFLYDRLSTLGVFRGPAEALRARSAAAAAAAADIIVIPDTANAEDLHLDPVSGLIFAAAQDADDSRIAWFPPLHRFADPAGLARANGGLRVIDPKTFTAKRLTLHGFSGPFCTHGIDIIADPDDATALYIHAVNHAPNPAYAASLNASIPDKAHSRVEIFHHVRGSNTARHVRTVSHPLITTPNDIYSTGPLSFYVTNDHYYREGPMRLLEDLGNRRTAPWSTLLHVEADATTADPAAGVAAKVALSGLHNNNGLGRTLIHGEVMICDAAGGVTYFAHARPDRTLDVFEEVKFETTIDNPSWFQDPYPEVGHDASGLVNSGLAHALKLANDVGIPGAPIPPVVWLARGQPQAPSDDLKWNTTLLFADDGSTLRSASAAIVVAIDPAENAGRKQAWLFVSGFAAKNAIAVKVDL